MSTNSCGRCRELERRCALLEQELSKILRVLPVVDQSQLDQLTEREIAVLDLIAQGLSTAETAEALHLSANSVKTHTRKLYNKIGVSNRSQATLWALARHQLGNTRPASS